MNDAKYIRLDVHQATISATVLDSAGKLVNKFRTSQPATKQQRQHRIVSLASDRTSGRNPEWRSPLLCRQPVSEPDAEPFGSFHPTNARRKFWTEQSAVSRFVG